MKLDDLRSHVIGASTEDLQERLIQIRRGQRTPRAKDKRKVTKNLDTKLDALTQEGLSKLIEILEASGQ